MRMTMDGGLYADPWWTIHFRGQGNHVGTSHIPLRSNFNHIFITWITSAHIILTYPLQGTSDQNYYNCHVHICLLLKANWALCNVSLLSLNFEPLMTLIMLLLMMMTMLLMMMLIMMTMMKKMMMMTMSTSSYWKNDWKDKKNSPGKSFLYLCVLRFSAWSGQGMNNSMPKDIRYKRLRHQPCFPDGNYQQQILGWIGNKYHVRPYGGNIICRVILVSPFL